MMIQLKELNMNTVNSNIVHYYYPTINIVLRLSFHFLYMQNDNVILSDLCLITNLNKKKIIKEKIVNIVPCFQRKFEENADTSK